MCVSQLYISDVYVNVWPLGWFIEEFVIYCCCLGMALVRSKVASHAAGADDQMFSVFCVNDVFEWNYMSRVLYIQGPMLRRFMLVHTGSHAEAVYVSSRSGLTSICKAGGFGGAQPPQLDVKADRREA